MNNYYKFSDGMFTYFVNTVTGNKKFSLDDGDNIVEWLIDDFYNNREIVYERL